MRLVVTAFFLIGFSSLTLASVIGQWQGSGRAWDTDGFKTECGTLTATVIDVGQTVELRGLAWDCKDAGFTWPTLAFGLKEGRLFEGDLEVGAFLPTKLLVRTGEIDLPVEFALTLKSEDVLLYQEKWIGKDSTYFVEGELNRL